VRVPHAHTDDQWEMASVLIFFCCLGGKLSRTVFLIVMAIIIGRSCLLRFSSALIAHLPNKSESFYFLPPEKSFHLEVSNVMPLNRCCGHYEVKREREGDFQQWVTVKLFPANGGNPETLQMTESVSILKAVIYLNGGPFSTFKMVVETTRSKVHFRDGFPINKNTEELQPDLL